METLRLAAVGIGSMGTANARVIYDGKIKGAKLTAVCDINPGRLKWAEEHLPGTSRFEHYIDLLDSHVADAVYIATPHILHPEIASAAFAKGYHVLTEKPAGVCTDEVEKMNGAAARSGKVFGIMYNQRTNPVYQRVRQLVHSGELGVPRRLVWNVTNWFRTQAYYDSCAWRATWEGEGAGVLINQSVHNLDLWQWIFGMPKRVRAFAYEGKYHHIEVEDDATIFAEYDHGATALFIASTGEAPGENRLEIAFDKGRIVVEDGKLTVWRGERSTADYTYQTESAFSGPAFVKSEEKPDGKETAHAGILQNFTDAVLYGTPLLAPGAEGIFALSLCNAALLSAWTDDWVELPIDGAIYKKWHESKIEHSIMPKKNAGKMLELDNSFGN